MEEYINRQAAIDAIRAFYDEYIVYDNGKSIEDLISELPSAQQWIPVTERLPEEEKEVLVTGKYGEIDIALWKYESWTDNVVEWEGNGYSFIKPIAWMPLPKPWKGGDSDGT